VGEDRDAEIFQLAQGGMQHTAIAEKYGISRQRVGQIVADMTPAAWGFTDRDRAQIRAMEMARLESIAQKLERLAERPPEMHSAIGKIILDSEGRPVLNEGVRVQALRELRLNSESRRRLTGADLGGAGTMPIDEARRQADASMAEAREKRARELAELAAARGALAAIPQPGDDEIADAEIVT
jgi:hypothetical protein